MALVATVIVSIVGAKAYKIFDTSIGGEAAYESSGGRGADSSSDESPKTDVS